MIPYQTRQQIAKGDSMHLIPALDIRQGGLTQRDANGARVACGRAPGEVARHYQDMGFRWLHIYDIDAAEGRSMNAAAVAKILSQVAIPVQISGGIHAINRLSYWLEAGATRIVLDSACVLDTAFLQTAVRLCPERICGAVEISRGHLVINGRPQLLSPPDAVRRLADAGVRTVMVIDHDREAQLRGANISLMAQMAQAAGVGILACGGISSPGDISALKARHAHIRGAVIGRALADGLMGAREALDAAAA